MNSMVPKKPEKLQWLTMEPISANKFNWVEMKRGPPPTQAQAEAFSLAATHREAAEKEQRTAEEWRLDHNAQRRRAEVRARRVRRQQRQRRAEVLAPLRKVVRKLIHVNRLAGGYEGSGAPPHLPGGGVR